MQTLTVETNRRYSNVSKIRNPEQLSIHGYKLGKWLGSFKSSNGIYFLDMDAKKFRKYSIHFRQNNQDNLMHLDYGKDPQHYEEGSEKFLKSLLFDLDLFTDEPILVWNKEEIKNCLCALSAIYYEHYESVKSILKRIIPIQEVFTDENYHDPRIKEYTVDGIYRALYPSTSRTFIKTDGSYGMHLITLALESIFYQINGNKTAA